jgi:uncharacterized membrane protein
MDDATLEHFRKKPRIIRIIHARQRLLISLAIGLAVIVSLPAPWRWTTRALTGWDVAAALYMVFAFIAFANTDRLHIRRNAQIQDDGRFVILILVAVAGFASLGAIIALIGVDGRSGAELALAAATIILSWAAIHTTFALHYAHDFYSGTKPGGLEFPGDEPPDYWDFVYFSFVIGTTAQTSDVAISDRMIRRIVIAHGLVSFLFNTALLALMVSIAASALFVVK